MIPAVTTTGLTRRFGDFTAVQDVNLTVAPGQFFGFLGPNGAGKSTTIKMLTGLLAPTSGSIQILGLDAIANPIEVKRQIGVVPEGLALFGRLTAAEYLRFVGRMYGLDAATTAARTTELLEFMSLANETKKLITDFSHGMQKKLALAAAVIHGPKVLFLDEPFEGVDAIASGTLKAMLQHSHRHHRSRPSHRQRLPRRASRRRPGPQHRQPDPHTRANLPQHRRQRARRPATRTGALMARLILAAATSRPKSVLLVLLKGTA